MNKKPGLLFTVCLLAMIVLATSFGFNYGGNPPVRLQSGVNPGNILYVCPAADSTWNQIAQSLQMVNKYAYLAFFFAAFVLLFSWGWAFYQNLLKDKFNDDAYKNSWDLTKIVFWCAVVYALVVYTPNHFRRVEVRTRGTDWVLCENISTGAKAANYKAVTLP